METLGKRTVSTAAMVLDELVLRVVRFPLWWYSRGITEVGQSLLSTESGWVERLGIRVLLANFFVPMFGDYTRSGRLISFFIRLVLFIVKGIFLAFLSLLMLIAFLIYLALPIVIAVQLVYQFGGPLLFR